MHHILYKNNTVFDVALLIKPTGLNKTEIQRYYYEPLISCGVKDDSFIAFDLDYGGKKKPPAPTMKAYLAKLLKALDRLQTKYLLVADGDYFKKLTGVSKAEPYHGSVLPCTIKGYEHMQVILSVNHQALFYNPTLQAKLDMSLDTLASHMNGSFVPLGDNIIHSVEYLHNPVDIEKALDKLHQYDALSCDTETFDLKHPHAGLGTITFCWNQHEGIAFTVESTDVNGEHLRVPNPAVKRLLLKFFTTYTGKLIYHNANFDIKILVYYLFMKDLDDVKGMINGINVMTRNIHDTKIITYLATNSTAGNKLSLKDQAHEFTGNYAQDDINDITKISIPDLLQYNLIDGLATWYVFNKHYQTMLDRQQEQIYNTIMLPSIKVILQMELVGLPLNMDKVHEAEAILDKDHREVVQKILNSDIGKEFQKHLQRQEMIACNDKWKKKKEDFDYFDYVTFNPASATQLQTLIYGVLGYEVKDFTKAKKPSTEGKVLKKLMFRATEESHKEFFQMLIDLSQINVIRNNFIKAFLQATPKADGRYYLFGSFNLGGTVSGRLSSSNPNLQNLPSDPSKNKYTKIIKACVIAPDGWLFCGADFASLEDRISALTTKDPMKLKVYTDGFDGHSLRAAFYFKDEMPDIDVSSVDSVNSIKVSYPAQRQKSKVPTFALTYGGTYKAICDQTGLPEIEAKAIEQNYHELYKVSDEWVQAKLQQASIDGYVTVAFGLRIETPILKQVLMDTSVTPYEAQSEGRTAGNAFGQSYGLLNNRAAIEFQERTLAGEYLYDILPVAHIHDAQYFLIRNHVEVVKWVNDNLCECMAWQDLPEIYHDKVKLGGNLGIFYPDWTTEYELPNSATTDEIMEICRET